MSRKFLIKEAPYHIIYLESKEDWEEMCAGLPMYIEPLFTPRQSPCLGICNEQVVFRADGPDREVYEFIYDFDVIEDTVDDPSDK